MSNIRQTQTIYVVEPIYEDNLINNKAITGYGSLKTYEDILVINAYSEIDRATYGNQFNLVMKFYSKHEIIMDTNIQYGIFLEMPEVDGSGMYQNPTYLSTPLISFNGKYLFDGKKQEY